MQIGTPRFARNAFYAFAAVLYSFLAIATSARAAVFRPESFTLANGLQIVIVQNRLSPAVSQMVWYKVGSADEPSGLSGLAHYLEHLMFRGTAEVPPGQFSRLIAGQGGNKNAFTSHDYTAYHEEIAADRLGMIMHLEADRMENLKITPETATPELDVVLSEREERTGNSPRGLFRERVQKALFPGHPYGIPVIGWRSEIEKITVDDVKNFYRRHYAPNNAAVIISGNVDTAEVLRLAAATFGRAQKRDVPLPRSFPEPEMPQEKRIVMTDARVQQPMLAIYTLAPSYATQKKNEAYALEVLNEALDGGEVGLLYKQLVVKKAAASGVGCSYNPSSRSSAEFIFYATPNPGRSTEELEKILLQTLRHLAQKGLNAETVAKAKERLSRSAIFARDSLTAPGYVFGEALTTDQTVEDVENWPEAIEKVTAKDVNAALQSLLANRRRVTGLLLPETSGTVPSPEASAPDDRQTDGR